MVKSLLVPNRFVIWRDSESIKLVDLKEEITTDIRATPFDETLISRRSVLTKIKNAPNNWSFYLIFAEVKNKKSKLWRLKLKKGQ